MQIINIPVVDLAPYARNSRTHTDKQIDQIARSIDSFGFCNPVLIDCNNVIIAGHGRVLAAQKIGKQEVPCVRLEHLTPHQVRAYVIADNKLATNAGWDEDVLRLELQGLQAQGVNVTLTGFDEGELMLFLSDAELEAAETEPEGSVDKIKQELTVVVECDTERQAKVLYNELTGRKFKVSISA